MTIPDTYEVTFSWPHPEPNTVILTGTFDEWSASTPLTKTPTGFEGTAKIPWGQKIKYKFIVDGEWIIHEDQPTETDPGGFVNNVYTAPLKPAEESPSDDDVLANVKDEGAPANGHAANGHSIVAEGALNLKSGSSEVPPAEQEAKPAEADAAANEGKVTPAIPNTVPKQPSTGYPQMLADLANTIVARDGTSSTLEYVASGLGAAMHSMVGVDPINIQKISIPTPQPDDAFTLPGGDESVPSTADLPPDSALSEATEINSEDSLPSPVAPIVPILIVPVNAAENNTAAPLEAAAIVPTPVPEAAIPADVRPEVGTVVPVEEASKVEEPSTHLPPVIASEVPPESTAEEITDVAPASSAAPWGAPAAVEAEAVVIEQPLAETAIPEAALVAEPAPEVVAVSVEEAKEEQKQASVTEESAPEPTVVFAEEPTLAAEKEPSPVSVEEPASASSLEEAIYEAIVLTEEVTPEPTVENIVEESVPTVDEATRAPIAKELITSAEPTDESNKEEPSVPQEIQSVVVEPVAPVVEEPAVLVVESTPSELGPTTAPAEVEEAQIVPEPMARVSDVVVTEESVPDTVKVADIAAPEATSPAAVEEAKVEEAVVVKPTVVEESTAEAEISEPEPSPIPVPDEPAVEVQSEQPSAPEPEPVVAVKEATAEDGAVGIIVPEATVAPVEPAVKSDSVKEEVIPTPVIEEIAPADKPEALVIPVPEVKPAAAVDVPEITEVATEEVGAPVKEERLPEEIVATTAPVASKASAAEVATTPAAAHQAEAPKEVATTPAAAAKTEQKFPSESSNDPPSSSTNTVRKKRTSIFGKLKSIFHHDKEKEKEKK